MSSTINLSSFNFVEQLRDNHLNLKDLSFGVDRSNYSILYRLKDSTTPFNSTTPFKGYGLDAQSSLSDIMDAGQEMLIAIEYKIGIQKEDPKQWMETAQKIKNFFQQFNHTTYLKEEEKRSQKMCEKWNTPLNHYAEGAVQRITEQRIDHLNHTYQSIVELEKNYVSTNLPTQETLVRPEERVAPSQRRACEHTGLSCFINSTLHTLAQIYSHLFNPRQNPLPQGSQEEEVQSQGLKLMNMILKGEQVKSAQVVEFSSAVNTYWSKKGAEQEQREGLSERSLEGGAERGGTASRWITDVLNILGYSGHECTISVDHPKHWNTYVEKWRKRNKTNAAPPIIRAGNTVKAQTDLPLEIKVQGVGVYHLKMVTTTGDKFDRLGHSVPYAYDSENDVFVVLDDMSRNTECMPMANQSFLKVKSGTWSDAYYELEKSSSSEPNSD